MHLGQSAVVRGYPPGVWTAPVIVAPFSLWAWWVLDHHSVANRVTGSGSLLAALVLIPLVIGGSHGLARVILAVAGRLRPGDRR
jgi:hypothetical protein